MKNLNNEPIHVKHSELQRETEESPYRSKCPCCEDGVLFMRRDLKTFNLVSTDMCISCGQQIVYDDIPDNTLKAL